MNSPNGPTGGSDAVNSSMKSSGVNPGGPGYLEAVCGPQGPKTVVKTANASAGLVANPCSTPSIPKDSGKY